jgi:nitrate reductase gamma subunit
MSTDVLFRVLPYVALVVLAAGLTIRYLRNVGRMGTLRAERGEAWASFGAGRLLRASLVALAVAHLVGLLAPRAVLAWDASPARLHFIEAVGMVVGLVALLGWGRVLWRHCGRHHPSRLGDLADSIFVSLVLVGMASGLATAIVYRWASSWGVVTLTPYAASLARGEPATAYAAEMPFLVQLHLVSAFGALALLPFTRLGPLLLVPFHRALVATATRLARPLAAAGRAAEDWLRRHNPGVWIWPKEE